MEGKLHLVMPMAGEGERFIQAGYGRPSPLLELWGKPAYYWAVKSVSNAIPLASLTFVTLEEHETRFRIREDIRFHFPDAHIVTLPDLPPGQVLTCLEGIRHLPDDGLPVLFNDSSHCFTTPYLADLMGSGEPPHGALLCFFSTEPNHSYLIFGMDGGVSGISERRVGMSQDAVCGAYWFADKGLFSRCAAGYVELYPYEEFTVAGLYNMMIEMGLEIQAIPLEKYVPLITPEQYQAALEQDHSGDWL